MLRFLFILIALISSSLHADETDRYVRFLRALIEKNTLQVLHLERAYDAIKEKRVINPILPTELGENTRMSTAYDLFKSILNKVNGPKLEILLAKELNHFHGVQEDVDRAREKTKEAVNISSREVLAVSGIGACAINEHSEVQCWGDPALTPPADLGKVTSVSVGDHHACALKTDRTVVCWGSNLDEQTDVPFDLGPVQYLTVNENTNCAITLNYTPRCWGQKNLTLSEKALAIELSSDDYCFITLYNSVQCGKTQVPSDLGPALALTAENFHFCVLKTDHTVQCFGDNSDGQATVPTNLGPIKEVKAGGSHTYALKEDGSLQGWGNNRDGQISTPPDLGKILTIALGWNSTCAVLADHTVKCWGYQNRIVTAIPTNLKVLDPSTYRQKEEL